MAFPKNPPAYRTFLLTMWEERNRDPASKAVWRFRLEDPSTGQQRGFADLAALVGALKREMGDSDTEETR